MSCSGQVVSCSVMSGRYSQIIIYHGIVFPEIDQRYLSDYYLIPDYKLKIYEQAEVNPSVNPSYINHSMPLIK